MYESHNGFVFIKENYFVEVFPFLYHIHVKMQRNSILTKIQFYFPFHNLFTTKNRVVGLVILLTKNVYYMFRTR